MARYFNGSTQFLYRSLPTVTDAPFTLAAWGYPTQTPGAGVAYSAVSVCNSASSSAIIALTFGWSGADRCYGWYTNSTPAWFGPSTYTLNTWVHGVWMNSADKTRALIYQDGLPGTNLNHTRTLSGVNNTNVGRFGDATPGAYFIGRIAEVGIWNIDISAEEVTALAAGLSPLLVRPENLVGYWPIFGRTSPEVPTVGEISLLLNGTPTQAEHPPVYYPTDQEVATFGSPVAAAAAYKRRIITATSG